MSPRVAVLVGNPKPGSRTRDAAVHLAGALTGVAPELLLRPVLTEVGATVPVPGAYVLDSAHDDPAAYDAWLATARPVIGALLGDGVAA